jgi:hypothetical protein
LNCGEGFKALPNGNSAPREAYTVSSGMNIFKKSVSRYALVTYATILFILRRPSLRAKSLWHTLCFTPIHQLSITVKPVEK